MWFSGLSATESLSQTAYTTITADGTSHIKGAWASVVASAPFDVTLLGISTDITHVASTDTSQLLDIGIGATEVVLIANIPTGNSTLRNANGSIAWFPVEIPETTKISARVQAAVISDIVDVRLFLFGSPPFSSPPTFQAIDTIGALTASSHGTNISSGSIVEIIASTAEDYKALGWGIDMAGDGGTGNETRRVEIFVGAGGVEKSLIANLETRGNSSESIIEQPMPFGILPLEMNIPAGSRLSAQTSSAANSRGLVLYGFR
jgi:hypothetical protein